MLRRFNLQFSIYDDARFEAEEGAFDFGNDQLVLSPWSFIKHNDTARMLLLESDWDFVIVDEAHHLNLGEEAQDELDVTLTQLARTSRGLLLLTATPGQSGVDSHFSRLQLLDPDRFSDLDKFTEEQRKFEQTYELIERLRAGEDVSNLPAGIDPTQAVDDIIQSLVDQYGTGRVLFRNSRKSVSGFPQRLLHQYELPQDDAAVSVADSHRTKWLATLLKSLKSQKVLVICRDKATAMELEHYLHLQAGIRCASFHEDLSLLERDRAQPTSRMKKAVLGPSFAQR